MSDEALARLVSLETKVDTLIRLQSETTKPNLRIDEFATLAGVSKRTVQRMISEGRIRKIGRRIPRDELSKYTS